MSNVFTDFESLRPDIYMSDDRKKALREQSRMPDKFEVVRSLEPRALACFLRYVASELKYDGIPSFAYGALESSESAVKNIRSVDCDELYEMLNIVADCIEKHLKEGAEK